MTSISARWFASVLLAGAFMTVYGQSSVPSENRLHAIVGARIEIGDGRVIAKGNVILRDGLIEAVGENVQVPPGADVLDGKGLTIFPGLIDAYTNKGLKLPDPNPNQDSDPPFSDYASARMREADRKGVRPELQARQYLNLTDDVLKPYRSAGFTTLMIAPDGGYLNGMAALVNLSGFPARDSVVTPATGQTIAFPGGFGGPNMYPGSLIGQIPQVRQALLDAQWFQRVNAAYRSGGTLRPAWDPVLEALTPLTDGLVPAMITADTAAQIDRALNLSDEFRLKPILVGGLESFRRVDRIKASGAPVLLALNFGKEPKQPEAKPADKPKEGDQADDPGNESIPDLPDRLNERIRLFQESAHNAEALHAAGIPFALSTRGSKDPGDFMTSLRAAVKNGLPHDVTLRALTLDAARIFKLDSRLGTLEAGKVANVVVMTGDFLDEKTKVKMLYIDGHKIDPDKKPVPPNQPIRFFDRGGL